MSIENSHANTRQGRRSKRKANSQKMAVHGRGMKRKLGAKKRKSAND